MDWIKNLFGLGSQDRQTSNSPSSNANNNKKHAHQPLLTNTAAGSTRHKDQGLDWYRAGLQHDEDGDEAHGFIVCDEKDGNKSR